MSILSGFLLGITCLCDHTLIIKVELRQKWFDRFALWPFCWIALRDCFDFCLSAIIHTQKKQSVADDTHVLLEIALFIQ